MYRFGLLASQAMIIVSVSAMWSRFMGSAAGFNSGLPDGLIAASFLVQFVGATALAYLVFVSCARVKNGRVMALLAVVNSALWLTVLIQAVTVLIAKMTASGLGLESWQVWVDPRTTPASLVVSLVVAFVPVVAVGVAGPRLGLRPPIQWGTVVPLAVVSMLMMVISAGLRADDSAWPACTWLIALGGAYLVLGLLVGAPPIAHTGRVLVAVDAVLMVLPGIGYDSLTQSWTVWASLAYLAVLVGLGYVAGRGASSAFRAQYAASVRVGVFVWAVVSLAVIGVTTDLAYSDGLVAIIIAAALIGLHVAGRAQPALFFRAVELGTVVYSAVVLHSAGWRASLPREGDQPMLDIILASVAVVGLAVVMVNRIREAARATSYALRTPGAPQPRTRVEVLSGIGLSVAVVGLLSPYDWFVGRLVGGWDWGYPTSLASMVVALAIVGLGLWSRVKPLRLYGLIVTIACVLKLVLLDIGSVTSITRVVAFLGGAGVCFGISALYNYAARHFDKELAQDVPLSEPGLVGPTPGLGG
jgi:hypothetical protein